MKLRLVLVFLTTTATLIRISAQDPETESHIADTSQAVAVSEYTPGSRSDNKAFDTTKIWQTGDLLIDLTIRKLVFLANMDSVFFNRYDKIITFDNEVFIVKIQNITHNEIRFLYPLNTQPEFIERGRVSQVIYASGKIDLFYRLEEESRDSVNIPVDNMIVRDKKDWERVICTNSADSVVHLDELGIVNALFVSNRLKATDDYLERNALIILRKKAANINGSHVLITLRKVHKGYGDLPSIEYEGKVYGISEKENLPEN